MTRAFALVAVLVLAGCATARPHEGSWVDGAVWAGGELRAAQRLELRRDGHSQRLDAVVEAAPSGITVVLLDALGRRLLLLKSGREGYFEDRDARLPRSVDGRAILADLLLVYWSRTDLGALLPQGMWVSEDDAGRSLQQDGRLLARVSCAGEPWTGRCVVQRPVAGYQLIIDSRREVP